MNPMEEMGRASRRGPSRAAIEHAAQFKIDRDEELGKLNEKIYKIDTELAMLRSQHNGPADTMDDATLERIAGLEQERRDMLAEFEGKTKLDS